MKAYRIKFWIQDTLESGHLETTGLIKESDIDKYDWMKEYYERVEILDWDEDYHNLREKGKVK